ncbi:MAG: uL15m family ribosomal protein [Nanobdellota archaeon]
MIHTKKVKKYRGSKTHGCGSMKKRRGAGNRGGRGNAGMGKKGKANKPTTWKTRKLLGRSGFRIATPIRAVGLQYVDTHLESLMQKGYATEENGTYTIDLKKAGYAKLIGNGKVTKTLKIIVPQASATAVEKVKNAGGEIQE